MQANGLTLTPGNVVIVCIVSTLAAIGSASIPNSALVSMITVLQVGHPSRYPATLPYRPPRPHMLLNISPRKEIGTIMCFSAATSLPHLPPHCRPGRFSALESLYVSLNAPGGICATTAPLHHFHNRIPLMLHAQQSLLLSIHLIFVKLWQY